MMAKKMKILIAYDGSAGADAALSDLRRAGLPLEAEARVLSVAEIWVPLPTSFGGVDTTFAFKMDSGLRGAMERAKQAAERVQGDFAQWAVQPAAAYGSVSEALLAQAEEWKSDLIVTGSHGHTALGRFFLGSVSLKLVNEAACSVRVARASTAAPEAPARILIGVDGSPDAEAAVQAVAARRWPPQSMARVVHAEYKLPPPASPALANLEYRALQMSEWLAGQQRLIQQLIEAAQTQLQAAGLQTSTLVREEDPKRLLLGEAESWGADCVFVGARGFNPLPRLWLGGVATAMVVRAPCSVEVVRKL
jgi:nucleotide-binding universal stress UspA family protein